MDLSFLKDSGGLFLPKPLQDFLGNYLVGDNNTTFYLTLWSVLHYISGILAVLILSIKIKNKYTTIAAYAFILHSLWEIWQILITSTPHTLRGYLDVAVDTILFMLGVSTAILVKK
jgi:hypothetical protein